MALMLKTPIIIIPITCFLGYTTKINNNIFDDDVYYEFEDGKNFMSGYIVSKNKTDYLYINSIEKKIYIYNLTDKILFKTISVEGWSLYSIIEWNESFLLAMNSYKKLIYVLDIEQGKAISCFSGIHSIGITAMKKIRYLKHGDSLLTSGKDNKIKLWILKQ